MSYSSRHQSSRRVCADTDGSGHATFDDYDDYTRSALSSHGSYVSSDNHQPRNMTVKSQKITATRYRIHTSGESTTSYHDRTERKEYTVYDSHRSSSSRQNIPSSSRTGYYPSLSDTKEIDDRHFARLPEARSQRLGAQFTYSDWSERDYPRTGAQKDGRHGQSDRHYSGADDPMPEERRHRRPQSSAKERSRYPTYAHAKHSQPKEPKPTYTDSQPSKSKSYSSHKYAAAEDPSHSKPESGSSRRQEEPHSSRSESRRGGNPRSNGNDRSHAHRERRHHQEVPQRKAKEELPDHYLTLKIGPLATAEEIKSAARRRRVEVHPDRLKKAGMSDSERAEIDAAAAKVGQAADVLQNPEQKLNYDRMRQKHC